MKKVDSSPTSSSPAWTLIGLIVKHVSPMFSSLQERTDDVNLAVQENLSGIRVVKSFVREDYEEEKFRKRNDALRSTSERAFGFVVMTRGQSPRSRRPP